MTRTDNARKSIHHHGLDGLLIASMPNIRYLSGFASDEQNVALLLVTREQQFLITDYRFGEQATEQCTPDTEVIVRDRARESLGETIRRLAGESEVQKLGYEQDHFTCSAWQLIADALVSGLEHTTGVSGLVEQLRRVKESVEIDSMRRAAKVGDRALEQLLAILKPGMSEQEAAIELEYALLRQGSEGLAFPTIFASGPRSSRPHGMPSERVLQRGDLITIDFGAVIDGYRSDMTRSIVMGRADPEQQKVYAMVREAQQIGLDHLAAGKPCSYPAQAVSEFLSQTEYARFAGEGLGHALGLETHEKPYLAVGEETLMEAGYVVTVEPGIYIPGWGGVRIEDDVLIGNEGIEILNSFSKELIEI
ncbi:M24 family metallopeptidase [Microbulbifer mangrovi]|uniref:M24 family metallopeptidase n=1 Tax=Microbulbifer mangrovi TaxID=927787 RepID=UPI0009905963|nr:aminopeptidase P family protein [Microbulbifer mangrovi]